MVTAILEAKSGLKKETVAPILDAEGISTWPFFHPLSSLPAYRNLEQAEKARDRKRMAYSINPYGINLSSVLNLTREQVLYVCGRLKDILRRRGY